MATNQKGTYALLAILMVTVMSVGMSVNGYPAGGSQQGAGEDWAKDSIANGCSCHMDEQLDEGMYMLSGIPHKYVPDTIYNVSLTINDTNVLSEPEAIRYGGFLAEVSEGAFQTSNLFWIGEDGKYISHNADSNGQRNWTFQWTAPSDGSGDALFTIYYNVVNGVGTGGDQWGYLTALSLGTPQVKSEEASIHELGVSLMQYWIALLAMVVVFVMILVAYFVIRGGSSHYRG
ncbi:MAG: hypothetical protein BEU00_02275 [Marine Group III euryarchaeote CG-Epi3]|uniref:Reelin domain-containing protein n=1 Tax=Marine Group III euryarchaeote CG-Epi3 TaxID=1888997 RepID=A0A1J5U578_9ARCH|nr:MAG: hypothetical protein BEU00_02275 [Marine Group III euryarchaeote CG-Epi3]